MEKRFYVCPSTDPISPAEENFEEKLIEYSRELASSGADFLHCDIMDGKFVERSTFDAGLLEIVDCGNFESAVRAAAEAAVSGDVVLMSPASAAFDQFKNFMVRGNFYKKLVMEL